MVATVVGEAGGEAVEDNGEEQEEGEEGVQLTNAAKVPSPDHVWYRPLL